MASGATAKASSAGIRVVERGSDFAFDGQRCSFRIDGRRETFDTVYAFLGCNVQSDLGRMLGAETDDVGALRVGNDQMTTVEGLYAAGDVVSSLNQISVAVGHAGIAATAIHRALGHNLRSPKESSSQVGP